MIADVMSKIWVSNGKKIRIDDIDYVIDHVRAMYGTSIQLRLVGLSCKTRVLTVREDNAQEVLEKIKD